MTLTYDIKVADNHGGSTTKTVTVTITGTDDKPVIDFGTEAFVNEQANKTLSLSSDTASISVHFTDPDLTNTGHTASVVDASASGATDGILPGALGHAELMAFFNINSVAKAPGRATGRSTRHFRRPISLLIILAAGETVGITYTLRVDDHAGGVTNQTVVVTVIGSNDKPV